MLKRMISFLLAVVLLVGMVPVNAAAAETEAAVDAGGVTIEGTNALGDLLTEEITAYQDANLTSMEEYEPGFSVTDLTFSGATATVTYDAMEEATLVVAVYTEDGLTLLNSAYKTVSPDATRATVTLSGEMPAYFTASAYLLNSYDLAPLCAAYHTSLYTRSIQDLKNSTVEDFPEEKILNLDNDNTTNFAVYSATTVVIDRQDGVNTVLSADEETMTYVIGNADAQFTSLQSGDVVAYAYAEEQFLFAKVGTIDVSGTTVTIHGAEMDMDDVFSHVKLEGTGDPENATIDTSTAGEGLQYLGDSGASPLGLDDDYIEGTVSKQFPFVYAEGLINSKLTVGVDANFSFLKADDELYTKLAMNLSVAVDAYVEAKVEKEIPLGKWQFPMAYGAMSFVCEPQIKLEASAKMNFNATVSTTVGFRYETLEGFRPIQSTPSVKTEVSVEGTVFLGVDLNPGVEVVQGYIFDVAASLPIGVEITAKESLADREYLPQEEPEEKHSCEHCLEIKVDFKVDFVAGFKLLGYIKKEHHVVGVKVNIGEAYYSIDHEEFDWGKCPYKEFRVTVIVRDSEGSSVSGASVETSKGGKVGESGVTNGGGICSIYLDEGSHTIKAVSGELQRTTTVQVEEPRKVTITLPENPEEEPEETTPMNPGGVLGEAESAPTMQPLRMTETGYLPENGMLWSIFRSEDWSSYKKIVITGSGALTRSALEGAKAYSTKSDGTRVEYSFSITTFMDCNEVVLGEGITSVSGIKCAGGTMGTTSKVTSVSLPSTLQEIGDSFFAGSKITSVALPSGLTKIGHAAFADCYNLKSIVIPASVQEIGDSLFAYCSRLQSVVFQGGITKLGRQTFYYCNQLTSVQLPNTLKELGTYNFQHCANLREINLPEGLVDLGTVNFRNCGLRKITIPSTVETIGTDAFQYTHHLAEVTISEGVKNIKSGAFLYCEALTSIRIPGSVESISQGAFAVCENLTEIEFAARSSEQSLTLGSGAFSGCTLKELKLPSVDSAWGYIVTVTDKIVLEGYVIPHFDESSEEYGSGGPTFGSFEGTIYYPYELCVINMSDDNPIGEAYFYTGERMRRMSPRATWVPYGVGEAGDMSPYESLAYCYYTDGINTPFDLPNETYANAAEYAETTPTETEPAVTEPMETVPAETVAEMLPAETVAETIPEETAEETVPMETVPLETAAAEAVSFTTVALPTPAGANTLRVSAPAASVRAMTSGEAVQTMHSSAPAMASIYGGEYSSEVTENRTVKTASFSGLVPGKEYVLLAVASLNAEDPLAINNLIHIDQDTASAEGTLTFRYVERQGYSASYVMVSGPSNKNLQDADITIPKFYASGEEQTIHPTVVYGGKILTEDKDYVLSGKVSFTEAGEYTCYIRGIYDYTGVVQCTYTVEGIPGTQPPVGRPMTETVKLFENGVDLSKQAVWTKQLNQDTANGFTVELTAEVMPAEASQNLSWSSSDTSVAAVSSGKVTFTGKAGDVTVTAEAKDGSGVSAKVTYRILAPGGVEIAGDSDIRILGGKSTTLKVLNSDTGKAVKAKDIIWTLDAGDQDPAAFASINASGKLTTKKVVSRADVTVYGEVYNNGNYVDTVVYTVSIYPAVTQVEIFVGEEMVNGQTLPVDTSGEVILPNLTAKVYPTDAMEDVTWESSSKKIVEIDPVTGKLTWMGKNGTVTITAAANDGSKKKATVKLTFGTLAEDLIIGIKNGKQITAGEEAEVISGKSLQLAAELTGNPTNKKVTWSLENTADSAYVKLSNGGKVTAKTIYEERTVIVKATAADGSGAADTFAVKVLPKDAGILVLRQNGQNVTKGTVYADMNTGGTVALTAHNLTSEEVPNVEWKSSKTAIATVKNGTVTFLKAGTVTITATDVNDGRKATVTVKASALASKVTVTGVSEVASGKAVTLKATAENASSSKVTWTITEGSQYAKIAKNGQLTANKDITSAKTVLVRATANDGSGAYGELTVTIRPIAQGVQIYSIDEVTGTMVLDVDSDDSSSFFGLVRSNTNFQWAVTTLEADGTYTEKLKLNANVYPYEQNTALNAIQGVTWKSSSKKVATVDENGLVTCLKAGSTTITATASDGSGMKATFELTVVKKTAQILLEDTYTVTAGKKLTLKPTLLAADGTAPTDKRVEYKITGGDGAAYASISQQGVLTTKKTGASTTVAVTVTALDGSGVNKTCTVEIQSA